MIKKMDEKSYDEFWKEFSTNIKRKYSSVNNTNTAVVVLPFARFRWSVNSIIKLIESPFQCPPCSLLENLVSSSTSTRIPLACISNLKVVSCLAFLSHLWSSSEPIWHRLSPANPLASPSCLDTDYLFAKNLTGSKFHHLLRIDLIWNLHLKFENDRLQLIQRHFSWNHGGPWQSKPSFKIAPLRNLSRCRQSNNSNPVNRFSIQPFYLPSRYVERMKDKQEAIFYVAGTSRAELESSPFVESLLKKGFEVLYLTEPVDEYTIQVTYILHVYMNALLVHARIRRKEVPKCRQGRAQAQQGGEGQRRNGETGKDVSVRNGKLVLSISALILWLTGCAIKVWRTRLKRP